MTTASRGTFVHWIPVVAMTVVLAACGYGNRMMRLVFVACAFITACSYEASFEPCTVHCTVDTGCPGDLTCGSEGLCRAAEAEACVLPSDGKGGTITHAGGRTIHTFSSSQSGSMFTPSADVIAVELLVVAGGGGGGALRGGGGGGAGGLRYTASFTIDQSSYVVTVGDGGAPGMNGGNTPAMNGGNSSFATIVAIGGGGGAGLSSGILNGGSGGGCHHGNGPSGAGTAGQGNDGGTSGFDSTIQTFTAAGGGGAGGSGAVGNPSAGGVGGPGLAYAISGAQAFYAGGGGGGAQDFGNNNLSPGVGGTGAGGDGGLNSAGKAGIDGTGGGGGGGGGGDAGDNYFNGGRGGDGIVIISYPTTWSASW